MSKLTVEEDEKLGLPANYQSSWKKPGTYLTFM